MGSQYDKLGDLLNEAISKGKIPQPKENKTNDESVNFSQKRKEEKKRQKSSNKTKKFSKKYTFQQQSVYNFIHLYKVFNLEPGCTLQELKSAYRQLVKKYHPDNIPNFPEMQKTAAKKTRELVEAYEILSKLVR